MGTNAVGDSILETDIEGWLRFKIVNSEMVSIPGEEYKVVCFILQDSIFHFQFSNYLFNFFENMLSDKDSIASPLNLMTPIADSPEGVESATIVLLIFS